MGRNPEEKERYLEMQELEKKRIARELHDTTVQNLTAMVHKIEYCTRLIDADPISAKLEMQTMISTIRATIEEMRGIIYDLRPMTIDDLPMEAALQNYLRQIEFRGVCRTKLTVIGEERAWKPVVKQNLFRIIQEACNNAVKHASPERIWVELEYGESEVVARITDDGCGFDMIPSMGKREDNFGISIMKERASMVSGKLEIESVAGKGTKIMVYVPSVTEEMEETV